MWASIYSNIIKNKDSLRERNSSNNSSSITKNSDGITEVYGKTYGASKYESGFLALAASKLVPKVVLYEIIEGNLKKLPKNFRDILKSQKKIKFESIDTARDKNMVFPQGLRNPPKYHAALLRKWAKKCAFCGYDNASKIEGAHIWGTAVIQRVRGLSKSKKIEASNDGDNGLWLCGISTKHKHHRMFDNHEIIISKNGDLKISSSLTQNKKKIQAITVDRIGSSAKEIRKILTPKFLQYLKKRNKLLPAPETDYVSIAEIR